MVLAIPGISRFGQRSLTMAVLFATALGFPNWSVAADGEPSKRVLRGIVVDAAGAGAVDTSVSLLSSKSPAETKTDNAGRFVLEVSVNRLPGCMLVARRSDGLLGFFQIPYEAPADGVDSHIVLRPARSIEVAVLDLAGKPIEGALVAATVNYERIVEQETGKDGTAVLQVPADAPLQSVHAVKSDVGLDYALFRRANEPASDPYRLAHDHAGPVTLTLSGTRTITVRVVDDLRRPLADAHVYPWYIECPRRGGIFHTEWLGEKSGEPGIVVFRTLPAGNTATINFWARLPEYDSPQRWMFDPAKAANEVTAVLVRQIPLQGSVVDTDGQPVAGSEVAVSGDGYQFDGFGGSAVTGADGRFELLVTANQYFMVAAAKGRLASATRQLVVRASVPHPEIKLTLQPATRIHGTLTVGDDRRPVAGEYLSLYRHDRDAYYKLPEAEQLPNSDGDRKGIFPVLTQSIRTDASGAYEFFTGPGKHYIVSSKLRDGPQFEVANELELQLDLRATRPEPIPFKGRVVLAADPNQAVAEATVVGWGTAALSRRLEAVSNSEGKFEALREASEMYLYARTSNGLLAGMVKIPADAQEAAIPIGPLASARGHLFEGDSTLPLPGRRLDYGFRITHSDGTSSQHFGGTVMTDARGEFTIDGLMPGWAYDLSLVTLAANGRPESWRTISTATPAKAERTEIGVVRTPSETR